MEELNITSESLTGENVVTNELGSSGGGETVDNAGLIKLEQLNALLGKDFKDVDTALKSIKDTQNYVGKRDTDIRKEVEEQVKKNMPQGDYITKSQYETDMFYKDNPNLALYRDFIDSGAKGKGITPREFVNDPGFKSVFDKVATADELQNAKSVLESNPRLGQATTRIQQAQELLKTNPSAARDAAVAAVMEATN